MGLASPSHLVPTSLCDLGRVTTEPPVPGHDPEEDVDVGSCRLGRFLRQPGRLRAHGIISDRRSPGLTLSMGTSEARPLLLFPEKTVIVGWGVPHPQRWRYEKTQGQIHSLPRVRILWFELDSGPVLLLVNRAPLESLSFSSLILAV